MNINNVILGGRMSRDPETKAVGGSSVTTFSIAVNDKWKDKSGEWKEHANFIDCKAWGKTGENIAKFFTKGQRILIEGSLRMEAWEAKDGSKRSKLEVNVDNFHFVESREGGAQAPAPKAARPAKAPAQASIGDIDDSGIPF